jgi:hypothetical protein
MTVIKLSATPEIRLSNFGSGSALPVARLNQIQGQNSDSHRKNSIDRSWKKFAVKVQNITLRIKIHF